MSPDPAWRPEDALYMARALELAQRGLNTTDPNPRVGCVIVKQGKIVGEGWHERAGGPHAEVNALRAAGTEARDATVYVSLEPCSHHGKTPPCSEALIKAGVRRVVAATEDPNPRVAGNGLRQLQASGIDISCGLLRGSAVALNPGFHQRMQSGRPWIRSKLAMSLDGRTAMASGESRWITGAEARRDVHRWRARSSCIVTGIDTVLADDPELTVRLENAETPVTPPARVILDSNLRCPALPRLAQRPGRAILLTTRRGSLPRHESDLEIVSLPANAEGRLDLSAVIEWLGIQEFNEVLFEAGPTLNGALLRDDLVDEWIVFMAPVVLGDGARGLFHLPELTRMAERHRLPPPEVRAVGQDVRFIFRRRSTLPP
ncbi:MAG: bifunctional diaminohydroxyphosphoribosylaminopyrimidine deaminase/5-amino-6-(5-phosphoribosylamino)uracil reductase RibD [Methylococcus sp.]